MFKLWKRVKLGGHTEPQSEVLEAHDICTVRSRDHNKGQKRLLWNHTGENKSFH